MGEGVGNPPTPFLKKGGVVFFNFQGVRTPGKIHFLWEIPVWGRGSGNPNPDPPGIGGYPPE